MSEANALAKVDPNARGLMRPIADPGELLKWHDDVGRIVRENLKEDIDYGVIPGTGDKPTLLKPGAEKLCQAFGLIPTYEIIEKDVDHDRPCKWTKKKKKWGRNRGEYTWEYEEGTSLGLYRYVLKCRLTTQDGRVVGEGVGSCSSLESKYIDRPRDCENTVLKMAKKRSQVDVVLSAFSLSNRFTQDVEEIKENRDAAESGPITVDPPAPTEVYTGTAEQQARLVKVLERSKLDEALWEKVGEHMKGKPTTMASVTDAISLTMADVGAI